jgi:hypothetical protein
MVCLEHKEEQELLVQGLQDLLGLPEFKEERELLDSQALLE